ncbi:MAG: hypothetical protein K8R92_06815 [Planctomycetes bacterium]|nr:hypothetical protein [Planctomycetota bacterium]
MPTSARFKVLLACLLAALTSFSVVSIGAPGVNLNAMENARANFAAQHPEGGLFDLGPRLRRAYGFRLATGDTPSNSGTAFFQQWAAMWGVDANDLQPIGPFEDGAHLLAIPGSEESDTDFTGVYFTQTAAGVPVFRSYGWALTRNEADFPVVLAGGTLRPIGDFAQQIAGKNLDQSTLNPQAFTRHIRNEFSAPPTLTTPRYVVWAGIDDDVQQPRLGVEFVATGHPAQDPASPMVMQYVVDAADGTVLHAESKILHVDFKGSVGGYGTSASSHKADACDPESSQSLPFAKVTFTKTTSPPTVASVFTDINGNYTYTTSDGSTRVIQPSIAEGQFFQVMNQSGDTITVPSKSSGSSSILSFTFNPEPRNELTNAQINAYIHANKVRSFALGVNPSYPVIGSQTDFPLFVNINDACNAYYDGFSLNFFKSGGGCNNTAFSGVVHHEYGHHLVQVGGSGQGAFGEGFGDVMAVLVTDDPLLGVGFQSCSNPLRNADNTCQYNPGSCSSCGSEIHACGQLLSGIVWDVSRNFKDNGSPLNYIAKTANLALNEVPLHAGQSDISGDIQLDYLTLDDNNGNLFDGTPNSVLVINPAFLKHGFGAPRAPTGLSATDGTLSDRVRLVWDQVLGFTSFQIWRSSTGVPSAQIGTSNTKTYDDMTAVTGTVYTYQVKAVNPIGTSPASVADTGYISISNPTGVAATDGTFTDKVLLTWNAVGGASNYKILRRPAGDPPSGPGLAISDFETHSSSISVSAPAGAPVKSVVFTMNDLTHTWMGDTTFILTHGATSCVLADMCGDEKHFDGDYTMDDTAAITFCQQPSAGGTYRPTNLMGPAFAGQAAAGVWTVSVHDGGPADTGGFSSWNIVVTSEIGESSTNSFTDTTAIPGVLYIYSVTAISGGGAESAPSTTDTGWRKLSKPANFAASDEAYIDRVVLGWNAVEGATGYQILRGIGDDAMTPLGTSATNNFTDLTAAWSTVYKYAVIATCPVGNSETSETDQGSRGHMLPAPSNFAASDGLFTYKVALSWNPVIGATSYQIFRNGAPLVILPGNSSTTFADTSVAVLVEYSYTVRALFEDVASPWSTPNTGFRSPIVVAPLGVNASDGTYSDKVLVTWSTSPGASFYEVYRSGTAAPIGTVVGNGNTSFSDTTAHFGQSYYYQVKSGNAAGTSVVSVKNTGYRRIRTPQNVVASDGTYAGKVVVTWSGVDGATGYKIFRSGTVNAIGSTPSATVLTFSDFSALAGTVYTYTVVATSATGLSEPSTGDTGFPGTLSKPIGLAASDGTYTNKVRVTWTKLVGASSYKIYRDGILIGSSVGNASTVFNDEQAGAGIVYTYRVRGVTSTGLTEQSDGDTGYCTQGSSNGGGGGGSGGSGGGAGNNGSGGGGSQGQSLTGSGAGSSSEGAKSEGGEAVKTASGGEGQTFDGEGTANVIQTADQAECEELFAETLEQMQLDPVLAAKLADRISLDDDMDGVMDVCQRHKGDMDLDGEVNQDDLTAMMSAFVTVDMIGDINLDGQIDGADFGLLLLAIEDHTQAQVGANGAVPVVNDAAPAANDEPAAPEPETP